MMLDLMTKIVIKYCTFCLACALSILSVSAQDTVFLNNASFEDEPHQGNANFPHIRGWIDCGTRIFDGESPPDIHPQNFWDVTAAAQHGKTYLGMVARYNETYEMLGQRVNTPLMADKCYTFKVQLSMSNVYLSNTHRNQTTKESFTTPCVLRLYGGTGECVETQLLAESEAIDHSDWREYEFLIQPKREYRYLMVGIFYKTPSLWAYNGNILVDNISPIIPANCPGEEVLAEILPVDRPVPPSPIKKEEPEEKIDEVIASTPEPTNQPDEDITPEPKERDPAQKKILADLDKNKIKTGQIIKVKQLQFVADSASFEDSSLEVLDEVYRFLEDNEQVIVEIGGHTNGVKGITDSYCDRLSERRAKTVANYLARRGISPYRLKYKGYGKRKPIASNRTAYGRSLNQRVEIKILSLDGKDG